MRCAQCGSGIAFECQLGHPNREAGGEAAVVRMHGLAQRFDDLFRLCTVHQRRHEADQRSRIDPRIGSRAVQFQPQLGRSLRLAAARELANDSLQGGDGVAGALAGQRCAPVGDDQARIVGIRSHLRLQQPVGHRVIPAPLRVRRLLDLAPALDRRTQALGRGRALQAVRGFGGRAAHTGEGVAHARAERIRGRAVFVLVFHASQRSPN